MHWIVDHANVVYLALGLVALGLLATFWLNRRVKFLGLAAGAVALMGLFWLLTQVVVTDRKQIRANLETMADAVVKGDADRLFRYVADDFRYHAMSRKMLYDRVKQAIKLHSITYIHLWDFEVESLSREARTAKVNFKATVHAPDVQQPFFLRSDFVLEGDVWKMKGFRVFNPIANTDQEITIPLP